VTRRKKKWILIGTVGALAATLIVAIVVGITLARRFDPFIREQAVAYLSERFNSDVELGSLKIRVPRLSPLQALFRRGHGTRARVEGENLRLRQRGIASDLPPLITIRKFHFDVDLGRIQQTPRMVEHVALSGMQINVPPKGERKPVSGGQAPAGASSSPSVIIQQVDMNDLVLNILPKNRAKKPLVFDIDVLKLTSAGTGVPMRFDAKLTNPKPPGYVQSRGSFGPWVADDPGMTPLKGEYTFTDADLSVFRSIAGILQSTGDFDGNLSTIQARGEARVPDFRLAMAGNRVPLQTRFEVLVDGTNGNTVLSPVRATLGKTNFTTSGAVLKREGDLRRTIDLDVNMPNGYLNDVLQLAMKGQPFMVGRLALKTKVVLPPLAEKVREKLILDGRFEVSDAKFLKTNIQDQIDTLSRRGQGQPKNMAVDEVVHDMKGVFRLEDEKLTFRSLSFAVPGASVNLAGTYDLDADVLDFLGALKLQAKVSQTMTGWKRWALKPVDPFFAKEGAGTFIRIAVTGSSREPQFGRARSRKE
jgi:hypothetical protein